MEASNELIRIFSKIEDPRKDINLRVDSTSKCNFLVYKIIK